MPDSHHNLRRSARFISLYIFVLLYVCIFVVKSEISKLIKAVISPLFRPDDGYYFIVETRIFALDEYMACRPKHLLWYL